MRTEPGPAPVVIAGWLVPGAGHFLLGRRPQALVFFLAVTVTYFVGMALADFGNVSPERHTYYFLAHIFNGGETMVAWFLTQNVVLDHAPRHFGMQTGEIGILYTAVASLLNIIAVMDAYAISVGLKGAGGKAKDDGAGEQTAKATAP